MAAKKKSGGKPTARQRTLRNREKAATGKKPARKK